MFTKAVDGQDAAQLTNAPDQSFVAFWSADGTRIYYTSAGDLWVVAATGGTPEVVLKEVQAATLHPDGRTLAFVRPTVHRHAWRDQSAASR